MATMNSLLLGKTVQAPPCRANPRTAGSQLRLCHYQDLGQLTQDEPASISGSKVIPRRVVLA